MKYIKLYESYDESNILDYFFDISDDDIEVNIFQGCLGFTTSGYSRVRPTVGISLDQILNILGNLNRMNNMGEFSVTKFITDLIAYIDGYYIDYTEPFV